MMPPSSFLRGCRSMLGALGWGARRHGLAPAPRPPAARCARGVCGMLAPVRPLLPRPWPLCGLGSGSLRASRPCGPGPWLRSSPGPSLGLSARRSPVARAGVPPVAGPLRGAGPCSRAPIAGPLAAPPRCVGGAVRRLALPWRAWASAWAPCPAPLVALRAPPCPPCGCGPLALALAPPAPGPHGPLRGPFLRPRVPGACGFLSRPHDFRVLWKNRQK